MSDEENNLNHEVDVHGEMNNGSWLQERKFVLSELKRLGLGVNATRNLMNALNMEVAVKMQKVEAQMHQFDLKLTKLTVYQTVILSVVVFAIKLLFKV